MPPADLGLAHRFVEARDPNAPAVLLLLHGTGGNENDLIPLGWELAPGAPMLSPRGQVLERGMPRFFRRLAEGVFDEADLRVRTDELADFIARAREAYGLGDRPLVAVGYSNGANIAASLLLLRPGTLAGALLYRAMVPLVPDATPDLRGVPVLLVAGRQDPIVAAAQADALAGLLRGAGADVEVERLETGHGLTREDVSVGAKWLRRTTGAIAPGR